LSIIVNFTDCCVEISALKDLSQNSDSVSQRHRAVQHRASEVPVVKPMCMSTALEETTPSKDGKSHKGGFMTLGTKKRLQKAFMNLFPRTNGDSDNGSMGHSLSNPDLVSLCWTEERTDFPEHVLKVNFHTHKS